MQGRPRVLSFRQERACVHAMTVGGKENASEAVKELRESEGVNVSGWTMRRALKRVGLSSRVKQKKPKLSSKHIRDCLDFAKMHRNWSINDWSVSDWERVIFLDECKINRFNSDRQSWCWVCDGQPSFSYTGDCEIWWRIHYDMELYDILWLWASHEDRWQG